MCTQSADVSSQRVCDTVVSCCSVPDLQEYLTTTLQFSDDNAVVTIYIWWTSDLQHILVMQGFWVQFCRHFSVIVYGFNWRDTSCGPWAVGFYLLAQDETTGLDVVSSFWLVSVEDVYWCFTIHVRWWSDLQLIFLVMQGFWVQFGAHFCVIMHCFIFSYKIDWFGCGFLMSSCVCWGCLLMLCSSRPSFNRRRFTWFTWTVCVCWLNTLFHQIKGPCTIQES